MHTQACARTRQHQLDSYDEENRQKLFSAYSEENFLQNHGDHVYYCSESKGLRRTKGYLGLYRLPEPVFFLKILDTIIWQSPLENEANTKEMRKHIT